MKFIFKLICFIAGIFAIAKLADVFLDGMYDSCGKKYFKSEDID